MILICLCIFSVSSSDLVKTGPGYLVWLWLLALLLYWYYQKLVDLCGCSKHLSFKSFAEKHAMSLESMMSVSYKTKLLVGDRTKTQWEGNVSSASYNGQSTCRPFSIFGPVRGCSMTLWLSFDRCCSLYCTVNFNISNNSCSLELH